jgi:hypothetical protein
MFKRLALACFAAILVCGAAPAAPIVPDFGSANFTPGAVVDNAFFPLMPGTRYTYSAEVEEDGETESIKIEEFVTNDTRIVAGVEARVVRVREWVDDLLVEDTFDWYAQDTLGNVWYLGEDSTEFEYDDDDNPIGMSKAGSWEAGVNGAQPGYIMEANPQVGDEYYQEFAPADNAIDQAEIAAINEMVSIDLGDFDDVTRILESTALEPGVFEYKLYARGIGLVLILEDLDEFGQAGAVIPLTGLARVPTPATIGLGAVGLMVLLRRRQRRPVASSKRKMP